MAVGVKSGPMAHYVDEETVERSVELPNREGELSFPSVPSFVASSSEPDCSRPFDFDSLRREG